MPNIKQVARLANVSVTTVSRVLNGHPYVSEEKRKAVLEALEQVNYSRNMNAVHLLRGKTNRIGVMLPYVNHPYFSRIMEGIAGEALKANYRLVLSQTNYQAEEELKALEMLREKQIDGLILCSKSLDWEQIEAFTSFGPIVACENAEHSRISSIYIDHYASFQYGIQHLIRKGHHRIGCCLGRPNSANSVKRRLAFSDSLLAINEPVREDWMFYHCYGIEDGAEVVHRLLERKERPSALLVTSDQVAAGIIAEAGNQGLHIPQDLAIIGFDNQPIAKVLHITTIDNQLFEMGSGAFRILHDEITGESTGPVKKQLQFQLMDRSTV